MFLFSFFVSAFFLVIVNLLTLQKMLNLLKSCLLLYCLCMLLLLICNISWYVTLWACQLMALLLMRVYNSVIIKRNVRFSITSCWFIASLVKFNTQILRRWCWLITLSLIHHIIYKFVLSLPTSVCIILRVLLLLWDCSCMIKNCLILCQFSRTSQL